MPTPEDTRATFLEKVRADQQLVRVVRTRFAQEGASIGYVIGRSDELLLLQKMSDRIDLDGYEILRMRDVSGIESTFDNSGFYRRALGLKQKKPDQLNEIDLSSLSRAIETISERYPLIVIGRERAAPGEVSIGRLKALRKLGFSLQWMTPNAELLSDAEFYRYSSVTRLEFGGEYEQTLALVAGLRSPGNSRAS